MGYRDRVPWPGPSEVFAREVRGRLLAPPAELILDALPPLSPQTRFLEVQAGGGVLARALVERIAGLGRLVAIDLDADLVEELPAGPRRATRAVAGFPALPFQPGVFDAVIANLVLGADDVDDAICLTELHRVLRPGGWLFVSCLVGDSFAAVFDVVADVAVAVGDFAIVKGIEDARARIPDVEAVRTRLGAAGWSLVQLGLEERLLGVLDGAGLLADPLVVDVVLGSIDLEPIRAALIAGIDDAFPSGLAVVVRTAICTARQRR